MNIIIIIHAIIVLDYDQDENNDNDDQMMMTWKMTPKIIIMIFTMITFKNWEEWPRSLASSSLSL